MAILLTEKSRIIVQGITGGEGTFHTQQMLDYHTKVVGGMTPGKGGQLWEGKLPIFNTMEQAVCESGANASVIFVPPGAAADAILEAIGAKVPVITTDAGGITDIIENNVTGVLVQQGRSDQLAEKIVELMGNQDLRTTLTENAYRKLLTDYTYPQMGRKYREVILQTVQRG